MDGPGGYLSVVDEVVNPGFSIPEEEVVCGVLFLLNWKEEQVAWPWPRWAFLDQHTEVVSRRRALLLQPVTFTLSCQPNSTYLGISIDSFPKA